MDDSVTAAHIGLYVNDFTVALGKEGEAAVSHLLSVAEENGIIPARETHRE
jgi:1,4-dihydroxy-6-naphthoate synthase